MEDHQQRAQYLLRCSLGVSIAACLVFFIVARLLPTIQGEESLLFDIGVSTVMAASLFLLFLGNLVDKYLYDFKSYIRWNIRVFMGGFALMFLSTPSILNVAGCLLFMFLIVAHGIKLCHRNRVKSE